MFSINDLYNKSVYLEGANKSIGKVRTFIFFKKRCIGLFIKRPDLLWMFRRKPYFVNIENVYSKEHGLYIRDKKTLTTKPEKHNKEWNETSIWHNMPIILNTKEIGYCKNVFFRKESGEIIKIELEKGKLSGFILETTEIKRDDIKEFSLKKQAIILKGETNLSEETDGIAEKAGTVSSKIVHKIKEQTPKATDKIQNQSDKIHKMFKDFKDEFKEGLNN